LPRHLISELIVDCHEDIAHINGTAIVWQYGMLLDNKTHHIQALVQADYHFRRLTLWLTTNPAAADFLAVLRHTVERILARIDIGYTENIRLPNTSLINPEHMPKGTEWADFSQILAMRDDGQTTYIHKSGAKYSISKILGLFGSATDQTVRNNITITNNTIASRQYFLQLQTTNPLVYSKSSFILFAPPGPDCSINLYSSVTPPQVVLCFLPFFGLSRENFGHNIPHQCLPSLQRRQRGTVANTWVSPLRTLSTRALTCSAAA
jgi:hypothetical protein